MNRIEIKATVITPVSIGNGTQFSPYKDYFISGEKVHYINEQKLGELLAKDERLMDEYVEGVANMEGNRSRFDIEGFIQRRLSTQPIEIVQNSVDFQGDSSAKLSINGFITTPNHRPYIPGSSIKGAIKTALIYTDLEKSDDGKKWNRDFFNQLKQIDFERRPGERFLRKQLKNQFDQLETKLKKKAEYKNTRFNIIERLAITDSSIMENNTLQVVDLKRTVIPVRQECLRVGSIFNFEIESPKDNWGLVQEKLNRFASNNLRYYKDRDKTKEQLFESVDSFFEEETKEAYLALGFGKGLYLNSIILSLKDYAYDNHQEKLFEKYLSVLFSKERNINIDSFPYTEFKTFSENQPLGWIKLEKTN